MLQGKKILLGITGSIAAYKSAFLVRLLVTSGAEVRVIVTAAAKDFVTPVTLSTLSGNPIISDFYEDKELGTWENHVDLGLWADMMVIAPASANTIAKMTGGVADNMLLTTYLSARCPVMICPAMDLDMYKHESVGSNLKELQNRGNIIIEPTHGELASGLVGQGRMEEPEIIVSQIADYFAKEFDFNGKKILITAGPTYEKIDPVRFIGNHSSGKMGFAIAEEAAERGARVTLVSGPVSLSLKNDSITRIDVVSAREMYEAVLNEFDACDVAILAAAVADYRPKEVADSKIKKKDSSLNLNLEPTDDILATLGKKKTTQVLVGFALETNNERENAKKKLVNKNLDFIVLNSLQDKGAGFAVDTNKITILDRGNNGVEFELKSKEKVATDIIDYLKPLLG
ncbi:MAG: bifunctional phosphopantothenoylcysteine decarboxylase/phosphopantothenate--cysteine ligase CoaBC [Crocinitomicaceae bacterium]|nr:bifunctional phosphopantothenoylcysteine decarboxylase/phosphopantothenate--cysteine ligase CoaBC [Crocinitomicaceae bacterium]|tara:strand:- start:17355 stop:18554 length:1200 start_codon:yes stop_codon:yes gene_type:complete